MSGAIFATQTGTNAKPRNAVQPASGVRNLMRGDTDTMTTQTITVTAAQHRLSFQGTGTVTLSGASTSGPLVGTGASDIVGLTFTPSAGSLTLTVSGTVEIAQLELGSSRSTYQRVVDAGRFEITETGQRPCEYLTPDGVDDWLQLASAFAPAGNFSIIAGVDSGANTSLARIVGNTGVDTQFTQSGVNQMFLRANGTGNQAEFTGLASTARRVDAMVVSGSGTATLWRDGVPTAGTVTGDLTMPATGLNAVFRQSSVYQALRGLHALALIPRALTDAERVIAENVMKYKMGL